MQIREIMQFPDISVVMSCYNAEKELPKAIRSVLDQTFSNYEFIIIDDGSTDKSLKVIRDYASQDNRIRVYKNDANLGLAASLNKGIEISRANYIARMDADDFSLPDRLSIQFNFMKKNPKVDILGSAVLINRKNGEQKIKTCPEYHEEIIKRVFRKPLLFHPTALIKKSVYFKHGFYNVDRRWAEDADLWYRIFDNVNFHNLQVPLLEYNVKSNLTYSQAKQNLLVKISNLRKRGLIVKFLPQLFYDFFLFGYKMVNYRF